MWLLRVGTHRIIVAEALSSGTPPLETVTGGH
jgi:hypothetical protein